MEVSSTILTTTETATITISSPYATSKTVTVTRKGKPALKAEIVLWGKTNWATSQSFTLTDGSWFIQRYDVRNWMSAQIPTSEAQKIWGGLILSSTEGGEWLYIYKSAVPYGGFAIEQKKLNATTQKRTATVTLRTLCGDVKVYVTQEPSVPSGVDAETAKAFWRTGAEKYLRPKGYDVAADFLEHSLLDAPGPMKLGNESSAAKKIKKDNNFLKVLDAMLANHNGETSFVEKDGWPVEFKSGDLFYAIHWCTIYFDGTKQDDGTWLVRCRLVDTYDYEISYSMSNMFGTIMNNIATDSYKHAVIHEYSIEINFEIVR